MSSQSPAPDLTNNPIKPVADPAERLSRYFPYDGRKLCYLAHCSAKHNYLYMEVPKVACSTVKRALQLIEVDGDTSKLVPQVHNRKASPLGDPLSVGADPDKIFTGDRFFRFAFVRNPYTRILSAYLDKIVQNEWERTRRFPALGFPKDAQVSLLQFLETIRTIPDDQKDIHWMPQSHILQKDKVRYDFIGRFENFFDGFAAVIRKLDPNASDMLIATRNDSHKTDAGRKVAMYIGMKERKLISEIFERDFAQLDYSFDPTFASV